jgi:hypothetical protein
MELRLLLLVYEQQTMLLLWYEEFHQVLRFLVHRMD